MSWRERNGASLVAVLPSLACPVGPAARGERSSCTKMWQPAPWVLGTSEFSSRGWSYRKCILGRSENE